MHHDSSKHGRHLDEAMRRETRELIRGGLPELRDEWLPEPAAEEGGGRPDWHAPGRGPGVPAGMTPREVAWRSEMARVLNPADFPVGRAELLSCLDAADAPEEIVRAVARLPADQTFVNAGDVVRALGIRTE
jgi:hypothetical protein